MSDTYDAWRRVVPVLAWLLSQDCALRRAPDDVGDAAPDSVAEDSSTPLRPDASFVDRGGAPPPANDSPSCVAPLATGTEGARPLGRYCMVDSDCASGVCVGTRCVQPCASAAECPALPNWACAPQDGGGVCVCSTPPFPEICNGVDDDCDGTVDENAECPVGAQCVAGACSCPMGSLCAGGCVDPQSDAANCGGCDRACTATEVCRAGACVRLDLVEVGLGDKHACALLGDGTVRCWGDNPDGRVGNGTADSLLPDALVYPRPVPVVGLAGAIALTARYAPCAVLLDGSAACWGYWVGRGLRDAEFAVVFDRGLNFLQCSAHPATLCDVTSVRQLALGDGHACALIVDGTVACWGANGRRQLGDGTTEPRDGVVQVHNARDVVQVASGSRHTCALRADGAVLCWGDNSVGQLGNGPDMDPYNPPPPTEPSPVSGLDDAVQIDAGGGLNCAVRAGGTVMCWGADESGQAGNGPARARYWPVAVAGLADVVEVAAAGSHACARRRGGEVWCWGAIALDGAAAPPLTRPTMVPGITDAVRVWSGWGASCAKRADGTLWCWGIGSPAQYADPPEADRGSPVRVQW